MQSSGNELQVSEPVNIAETVLGYIDSVSLKFLKQVWCASWLLSTVLVVSLGWPRPGSGSGPGQSDVISHF